MAPTSETKSVQPNIQDVFLNYVRREKLVVVVRMMDGSQMEGRIKNFDRFALVIDHGGSDHMIRYDARLATNPYHPFLGMWIAITRKMVDGNVMEPEQRITRLEALKMWTWNGE